MRNETRKFNYRLAVAGLAMFSIVAVVLFANFGGAHAQKNARSTERPTAPMDKVSHDLRDKMNYASLSGGTVKVILQRTGAKSPELDALLKQNGVRLKGDFDKLNATAIELPVSVVDQLAMMDEVVSVVYDAPINSLGHVNNTTGADAVRTQTNSSGTTYTLNGTGIGIAVIDSGMASGHKAFAKPGASGGRIVFSKDFTGENRVDDPFGHGTHVATAAAGYRVSGTSGNLYEGVAWNANLINLRVLDSQGTGTTSALLGSLNWVLTNRTTYNIRVVNISLGTPAINSYTVDPICLAVRSLVNAGVVVVAAAGNDGKSVSGQKQYGTIHSPGNEPSALTVGASNSFGTDMRSDDVVTSYSSRGPTRSYTTDTYGVKHYDNLVKPDLVAPGNKLVQAEATGNLVVTTYPNLDRGAASNNYRYMYMSGSSMATPITAGAAALVLQANPNLRPNMVKMILTYTAQQLAGYNTLEQGAGQLNIEGAIRLATSIKTNLPSGTALGTSMLNSTPVAQSTVAGTTFPWAGGMILDQSYGRGTDLITKYQKIYDLGVLVGDGTTVNTSGVLVGDLTKMTNGVLVGDKIMTSNGVLVGDGTLFMYTQPLFLLNGAMLPDGVLVGDGVLVSDGVLVGDRVLIGDTIDAQGVLINGDNTACMN